MGNTLVKLNYTGVYTTLKRFLPTANLALTSSNYLSLSEPLPSTKDINFHAGLLKDKNDEDNNYFASGIYLYIFKAKSLNTNDEFQHSGKLIMLK